MTPREILGVPEDPKPSEVREAFRRLARIHHPDRGGDPAKFQEVREARDALMKIAVVCPTCRGAGEVQLRNGHHAMKIRCGRCRGSGVRDE